MNDKQIKDKAIFVAALLAIFLAFGSFKGGLQKVFLQISGHNYDLWTMIVFMIVFLTLSIYFYALNYLRYSFGRHQNNFVFKIFNFLANFFYIIAILWPLLIVFAVIISATPINALAQKYKHGIVLFDIIAGAVLGTMYAVASIKRNKKEEIESIEKVKSNYLQKASQLYNNEFYGESVVEAFKTLEMVLREKLLEDKGLFTKYMNAGSLIRFAEDKKVVDKKLIPVIRDLQGMRNKIVHSSTATSKEQAQFALEAVRKILESKPV